MDINKIYQGDCLDVLKTMPADSVDSIVTDPPYGLSFMGKHWDYDVPTVDVWRECLRVLKPGGHLLSFAGTRTYHRMAVNIEDAGFEIRDMIAWIYGSGFPKSLNIGKAVDKLKGNKRDVIGKGNCGYQVSISKIRKEQGYRPNLTNATREVDITTGTSAWEGWGTALMRYLCRLVTPPGGIVLDPFFGSGSTGKAAKLESFNYIGIEREADYCEIAKNRIKNTLVNKCLKF